ncbi:hypothetical protein J6TS2_03190 [Heyndrickxia sporothermodurans]|nr:hypothetical protein J6TS2_03190 [Heyndrickxia sporothermodurans]
MEKNERADLDFSSLWIGYLSDSFPNKIFPDDSGELSISPSTDEANTSTL